MKFAEQSECIVCDAPTRHALCPACLSDAENAYALRLRRHSMDAHEALERIELEARLTLATVPTPGYIAKISEIRAIAENALNSSVDPWKEGYAAGESDATTRESIKYRALKAELSRLAATWALLERQADSEREFGMGAGLRIARRELNLLLKGEK